jgi:hypothetical protein
VDREIRNRKIIIEEERKEKGERHGKGIWHVLS